MAGSFSPITRDPHLFCRSGAILNDKRNDRLASKLLRRMVTEESNVIHRFSENDAEQKAFYRLINNAKVSSSGLIGKIVSPLRHRVEGKHVLILGDSSENSLKRIYSQLKNPKEVGVLSDNKTPGFHMHAHLCIDAENEGALGISDLMTWCRKPSRASKAQKARSMATRSWSEKESYKWHLGLTRSLEVVEAARQVTFIFDREADFAQSWESVLSHNCDAVIRMSRSWPVAHPDLEQQPMVAQDYLEDTEWAGSYWIKLTKLERRNYSKNKPQRRKGRKAKIQVRFREIPLERFIGLKRPLYLVEAKEAPETVPKGEEPVHWYLLTTHAVEDFEQACQVIRWYKLRWMIEQLFRLIKRKGFDIEGSHLTDFRAIEKQLILTIGAAFRVMQLLLARDNPNAQPIEDAFSQEQIRCLSAMNKKSEGKTAKLKNPYPRDRMSWAVWVIGRLGGWKGRQSQAPPGPIRLKRGYEKFEAIFEGWMIFQTE